MPHIEVERIAAEALALTRFDPPVGFVASPVEPFDIGEGFRKKRAV